MEFIHQQRLWTLENNYTSTLIVLSLVTLLISYMPIFPAFLKLRKIDKTERPYKVPGGKFVINLVTWVPFVLLTLSVIFTLFIDFTWIGTLNFLASSTLLLCKTFSGALYYF